MNRLSYAPDKAALLYAAQLATKSWHAATFVMGIALPVPKPNNIPTARQRVRKSIKFVATSAFQSVIQHLPARPVNNSVESLASMEFAPSHAAESTETV